MTVPAGHTLPLPWPERRTPSMNAGTPPSPGTPPALVTARLDLREHIVIVGGGFGGLPAASSLRHLPVRVTIIDQHNYHLFQPLLYQVATAGLSPADIASPIRSVVAGQRNTTVILAEVSGVDLDARQVLAEDRRGVYDFPILATG